MDAIAERQPFGPENVGKAAAEVGGQLDLGPEQRFPGTRRTCAGDRHALHHDRLAHNAARRSHAEHLFPLGPWGGDRAGKRAIDDERGHAVDLSDARAFVRLGKVVPSRLNEFFDLIKPDLIKYPALDPDEFKKSVRSFVRDCGGQDDAGNDVVTELTVHSAAPQTRPGHKGPLNGHIFARMRVVFSSEMGETRPFPGGSAASAARRKSDCWHSP